MFGISCVTKRHLFSFILSSVLCFSFSSIYAAAGCCSHHGGVKGCDTATNHQLCKDGTDSPTCLCNGAKTTSSKKKSSATTTTATTALPTTTPAKTTTKVSNKGCCARHGGVAGCDKATGKQMCKDGTRSSTCKC